MPKDQWVQHPGDPKHYGETQIRAYEGSLGAKEGILADIERAAAEVSALVHLRPALRDPSLLAGARRDRVVREVEQSESLLGPGGQRLGYEPGPTDVKADDAERLFGDYRIDLVDVADVDPRSLLFGPAGARPQARTARAIRDVNGDGVPDLTARFSPREAGLRPRDREACLSGWLGDESLLGCAPVQVRFLPVNTRR